MQFITQKHLSRRTLLRGAGVAIGLPFLDVMLPASAAEARAARKQPCRKSIFRFPEAMPNSTMILAAICPAPALEGSGARQ